MLLGTDVQAALASLERLPVDCVGLNCSTGPAEMRESVRQLAERCSHYVSVQPNAGMPENVDGRAVYKLSPDELAEALGQFVAGFGVDIVGGCCGTTPAHLAKVVERIRAVSAPRRSPPAPRPRALLRHEGRAPDPGAAAAPGGRAAQLARAPAR